MELREKVARTTVDAYRTLTSQAAGCSLNEVDHEVAKRILAIPEIREALSLKHSLETALRVNGSFHVTAENIASSGNSWAAATRSGDAEPA